MELRGSTSSKRGGDTHKRGPKRGPQVPPHGTRPHGAAYPKGGSSLLVLVPPVTQGLNWVSTVPLPLCLTTVDGPLLTFSSFLNIFLGFSNNTLSPGLCVWPILLHGGVPEWGSLPPHLNLNQSCQICVRLISRGHN